MAQFPCDFDGQRYRGPQQTIYPAVVSGVDQYRGKLRLCGPHFEAMLRELAARSARAQESYLEPGPLACFVCSADVVEEHGAMFATVYATGQDREDYWAPVHSLCLPEALRIWRLADNTA